MAALSRALVSWMAFLALSTLALMAGLQLGLEFRTVAVPIAALGFGLVAAVGVDVTRSLARAGTGARRQALALGALMAIAAGLAAAIERPDLDDTIYVPKSVSYVAHPEAPLDRTIGWIVAAEREPTLPIVPYYELTQAAFALALGRPFTDLYYVVFPALVGALMMLAAFLLIAEFEPRRGVAILGTAFLLVLALAAGETHRAYGNFTLARAFQAKCMFVAVGLPAWTLLSLRFLRRPDWGGGLSLAATATGMAGATTTAFVTLPFLAGALLVASRIAGGRPPAAAWLRFGAIYGSTLVPLLLMAWAFRSYAVAHLGYGSAANAGFPGAFSEQLAFLVNPDLPLMPAVFGASLLVILSVGEHRRFLGAWTILLALLLNPLAAETVMRLVTSENIYWRLFYVLPFPLVACLAFTTLWQGPAAARAAAVAVAGALSFGAVAGPTAVLRPDNGATLELPGNMRRGVRAAAEAAAALRPGSMLAPLDVSAALLLTAPHLPQYHMREDYLELILGSTGEPDEFARRALAYRYLYAGDDSAVARGAFESLLAQAAGPAHVVVVAAARNTPAIASRLVHAGYAAGPELAAGARAFTRAR